MKYLCLPDLLLLRNHKCTGYPIRHNHRCSKMQWKYQFHLEQPLKRSLVAQVNLLQGAAIKSENSECSLLLNEFNELTRMQSFRTTVLEQGLIISIRSEKGISIFRNKSMKFLVVASAISYKRRLIAVIVKFGF